MRGAEKDGVTSRETSDGKHSRVTATEMIGGVECRITLEQDDYGRYHEVDLSPVTEPAADRAAYH